MVKDVTKFHKRHRGVGVCLSLCETRFQTVLEFWKGGGGELQSSVLTWMECIACKHVSRGKPWSVCLFGGGGGGGLAEVPSAWVY